MRDRELRNWKTLVRERADREWRELSLEVVDELACHLADLHAEAIRRGASDDEARRIALEALNAASFLELSKRPRARRGGGYVRDLRVAVRQLIGTPVVTTVAVLSLALGIGANTAIFSLVNSLILKALPVSQPERLWMLEDNGHSTSWTNPIWEAVRARADRFGGAFAWSGVRFNLSAGGEAQRVEGLWASGSFFDVLAAPVLIGRGLTVDDDRRGGGPDGPVAVISHGFWQRYYGGSADVIGRRITLERVPFTIVGVTAPGFFGPDVGRSFDVVAPLGTQPLVDGGKGGLLDERSSWWLNIMIRSKPDQSHAAAEAALQGMQPQIRAETLPTNVLPRVIAGFLNEPLTLAPAATGRSPLRTRYSRPLLTMLVVVGLVLLVACANIANLQLARATARRHEVSVRLALGASRWQIARQFLIESAVLAVVGAGAGLLFSRWGTALIVSLISTENAPIFLDVAMDWRVLGFATGLTTLTAVLFGTLPAVRATRMSPAGALAERTSDGGAARGRVAGTLVIAQVALSLVLTVAAGLFVRTFTALARTPLGFDEKNVLLVTTEAPRAVFEPAQLRGLQTKVLDAIRGVPGVLHATISSKTPTDTRNTTDRVDVPGGPPVPERQRMTPIIAIGSDWFATYRTPMLAGREFDDRDADGSKAVAIVNEAFVRQFLNGANPIGRSFLMGGSYTATPARSIEIVGLTGDAVYRNLREPIPPAVYLPRSQFTWWNPNTAYFGIRTAADDPTVVARSVAAAVAAVDPNLVLTFRPLSVQVRTTLIQERLMATLAGFFGALALLLAGLGLYGVTSYAVSRRRTEIGIRMALGAAPERVVRLVLSRVTTLVVTGVFVGAGVSLWASQYVSTLVYGLEPRDPVTLAGAAVVLALVGGFAGWLPAQRASRIDPAEVLRDS